MKTDRQFLAAIAMLSQYDSYEPWLSGSRLYGVGYNASCLEHGLCFALMFKDGERRWKRQNTETENEASDYNKKCLKY